MYFLLSIKLLSLQFLADIKSVSHLTITGCCCHVGGGGGGGGVCVLGMGGGERVSFVGCCKERVGTGHIELERDYTLVLVVQELCESRGGRPGLSVRMSLLVSVDIKLY